MGGFSWVVSAWVGGWLVAVVVVEAAVGNPGDRARCSWFSWSTLAARSSEARRFFSSWVICDPRLDLVFGFSLGAMGPPSPWTIRPAEFKQLQQRAWLARRPLMWLCHASTCTTHEQQKRTCLCGLRAPTRVIYDMYIRVCVRARTPHLFGPVARPTHTIFLFFFK
jgi:hypothetical protein